MESSMKLVVSKTDAINICKYFGELFIKYYIKWCACVQNGYTIEITFIEHEMQSWWDTIKSIRIKSDNKPISNNDLMNWFFSAGTKDIDLIKDAKIKEDYKSFALRVISHKNALIFDNLVEEEDE